MVWPRCSKSKTVSAGIGTDSGILDKGSRLNASALAFVVPALSAILYSYTAKVRTHC